MATGGGGADEAGPRSKKQGRGKDLRRREEES